MEELRANILRIERISLSDGEGMRTVIFFKGCPLRCAWCSTPESWNAEPEMYYKKERCRFCGRCIEACPQHALTFDIKNMRIVRDYGKCNVCGTCKETCHHQAQLVYGKTMTVKQVIKEILKDELFYWHSGGGVTFSGGEALLYPDFLREVILGCKEAAINTAAELAMDVPWENVEKVVPLLDSFFTDIKTIDPDVHKRFTGRDNRRILENIKKASAISVPGAIHVRTPLVWGVNDDRNSILQIAEFCSTVENVAELEFLPYHRLGTHAYTELNREYRMSSLPGMSVEDAMKKTEHLINREWLFDITVAGHMVYRSKQRAGNGEADAGSFHIVKGCY